jgi:hypothetical protein
LSATFVIFEIARAVALGQQLLPSWQETFNARLLALLSHRPLTVVTITFLAIVMFAVPMAGVIYVALRIRRKVSRYWAGVNRQG